MSFGYSDQRKSKYFNYVFRNIFQDFLEVINFPRNKGIFMTYFGAMHRNDLHKSGETLPNVTPLKLVSATFFASLFFKFKLEHLSN